MPPPPNPLNFESSYGPRSYMSQTGVVRQKGGIVADCVYGLFRPRPHESGHF